MKSYLIILFFIGFIFLACKQEVKKEEYFVIHEFIDADSTDSIEKIYYGDYNFILSDSSRIFFFKYTKVEGCGTCMESSVKYHLKPPFIRLHPESIEEIEPKNLKAFLRKMPVLKSKEIIMISSPVDTIRNKNMFVIRDFFKSKKGVIVGIQRSTEEENEVLKAKISGKKYDMNTINWKVGFREGYHPKVEIIQFLPPVVDTI